MSEYHNEDIDLMLQVKENSLEAFERLYAKYHRAIGSFFHRMGCGTETSEDYIQEVFMRLWRARANYEPRAKFTTYLFQIAKNFWINEHEKRKRRPSTYHLEGEQQYDYLSQGQFIDGNLPDENTLSKELHEKIREAIAGLKENYRMVFILSEFQGLKYKEIAEILDIPIGTVKSRMATAEAKLRQKLKNYLS